MIRAAAKNHGDESTAAWPWSPTPTTTTRSLSELRNNDGEICFEMRRQLATKAFQTTAHYDTAIANWFGESEEGDFPSHLLRDFEKIMELSYGENPHQRAAYYSESGSRRHLLSRVTQLHGKKLSFNNLYDLAAARSLADEFKLPACVIIKHNNPCGCALADKLEHAYQKAFDSDPVSAFGSVIAVNKKVDAATATLMSELFIEVLFAPGFDDDALEILTRKKDIRVLLDSERRRFSPGEFDYKRVLGGLLVQDKDDDLEERDNMEVVTERHPTHAEWDDMLFAQRVTKHVKSNSIVIAKGLQTLGVGAGQMSRVDSTRIAIEKALGKGDITGRGDRLRRLLPVPRRGRDRHRGRRDRVHAPRRLQGRRRRHQGLQRQGRHDGPHPPAALPALARRSRFAERRRRSPSTDLMPRPQQASKGSGSAGPFLVWGDEDERPDGRTAAHAE